MFLDSLIYLATVLLKSGRGLDDILSFFEKDLAERLNWIASHGAEVKLKKGPKVILDDAKVTVGIISDIRKSIERMLCDFPCYYIEDKKVSFSVHYRNCKEKDLSILEEVKEEIKKYEKRYKIDYMEMKKVIEVKPAGIDKGMAVDKILTKYGKSDFISIAIGDDVTDEYTFRANKKGINIKVSENRNMDTEADHFIHGPVQVLDFLDLLIYRPKGRLEIKR